MISVAKALFFGGGPAWVYLICFAYSLNLCSFAARTENSSGVATASMQYKQGVVGISTGGNQQPAYDFCYDHEGAIGLILMNNNIVIPLLIYLLLILMVSGGYESLDDATCSRESLLVTPDNLMMYNSILASSHQHNNKNNRAGNHANKNALPNQAQHQQNHSQSHQAQQQPGGPGGANNTNPHNVNSSQNEELTTYQVQQKNPLLSFSNDFPRGSCLQGYVDSMVDDNDISNLQMLDQHPLCGDPVVGGLHPENNLNKSSNGAGTNNNASLQNNTLETVLGSVEDPEKYYFCHQSAAPSSSFSKPNVNMSLRVNNAGEGAPIINAQQTVGGQQEPASQNSSTGATVSTGGQQTTLQTPAIGPNSTTASQAPDSTTVAPGTAVLFMILSHTCEDSTTVAPDTG